MFRALLCPSSEAHDYNVDYHIGISFLVCCIGDKVQLFWSGVRVAASKLVFLFFSYHNDARSNKHHIQLEPNIRTCARTVARTHARTYVHKHIQSAWKSVIKGTDGQSQTSYGAVGRLGAAPLDSSCSPQQDKSQQFLFALLTTLCQLQMQRAVEFDMTG